jgi:hypothetical protein
LTSPGYQAAQMAFTGFGVVAQVGVRRGVSVCVAWAVSRESALTNPSSGPQYRRNSCREARGCASRRASYYSWCEGRLVSLGWANRMPRACSYDAGAVCMCWGGGSAVGGRQALLWRLGGAHLLRRDEVSRFLHELELEQYVGGFHNQYVHSHAPSASVRRVVSWWENTPFVALRVSMLRAVARTQAGASSSSPS